MAILIVFILLVAIPIYFAISSDKGTIKTEKYIKNIVEDHTEITPIKRKKNVYKKLSGFGKFVWFGMYASIWLTIIGAQTMSYSYNAYYDAVDEVVLRTSGVISLTGFVIFIIFLISSFLDGLYCEYKYEPGMEERLFSISGRISRLSYLKYSLFCLLTFIVLMIIPGFSESNFKFIVFASLLVLRATAAIRRAQDCGGSVWVYFIPFVSMILYFCPGDKDANDYGPVKESKETVKKPTTKAQKANIKTIKIQIINDEKYLNLKKVDRIKYLRKLKEQVFSTLTKEKKELETITNKLNDVPADIAKYVKQSDTSDLQHSILDLEDKIAAIDELIMSETQQPQTEMKPFEWWKY